MDLADITCIGVIGAGEMGHGIAECCALAGYSVFLKDIKAEILDKARDRISQSLESLSRKHRIEEDQVPVIQDRIQYCLDYADFSNSPLFCIETVSEIEPLKKQVYVELDAILPADAILATNTSTMSITELAPASRSDRFIGMHFFIPPVIMDPVEVIKGDQTSVETIELTKKVTESIGKIPIMVLKDVPGFMINRVQAPASILICKAVELGIATPNQIDAMSHKMGLPMGPFEIMDLQGLDTVKHATAYLSEKLGPDFAMPAWFLNLVDNGCLGRKSGKGVFNYSSDSHAIIDFDDLPDPEKLKPLDLIVVQINEACKLIEDGVVESPADVDIAIKTGTGNKAGIFGLLTADQQGVINRLDQLADIYQMEMFRPIKLLETIIVPNIDKILRDRKKLVNKIGK